MPRGDGTGPRGNGPGTGRGYGPCNCGYYGCGPRGPQYAGCAYHYGSRFGRPWTKDEERAALEDEVEDLEETLKAVKERLAELVS